MTGAGIRRVLHAAALVIVAFVLVYAVVPFTSRTSPTLNLVAGPSGRRYFSYPVDAGAPIQDFTSVIGESHCGAAIVDAWHAQPAAGGWFGYAPLATAPLVVPGSCRNAARHRLLMSGLGVLIALGLVFAARSVDRGGDLGFGAAPNPAT